MPILLASWTAAPSATLECCDRQGEADLHHAVAGGVAVRADRARLRRLTARPPGSRAPGCSSPRALRATPSRPRPLSAGRFIRPKVPSAIAASSGGSPGGVGVVLDRARAGRWLSPSTCAGAVGDEAVGRRAEVLVQVAGGVHDVADVLQRQVAVGDPRRDDGLGHHADQQDALAGERADEVEEPVEQVALEDVAGHVPGRRHPLQRRVGEQLAGEHRVGELEAERVGHVGVDLERVAEAELPVLEAGLLGEVLVEELARRDRVRRLDGVGGGEVVVLAGVDDDAGAGVDLAAEALVDEGADRVDVAEEDPVHRVVEHHVEPLEPGQGGDLGHAEPGGVVGEPDVAARARG